MTTPQKPKTIPFMSLKEQYERLRPEILAAVDKVFTETAFSGGPYVEAFEKEFAAYCGAAQCVAVSNGTDALHLAVRAAGIGPGDEVIVPANSFIATAWGPSHAGATPVFVDCRDDTWNIDPAAIEARITPRTRAIIGVHLYGLPFDVDPVREIARRRNLVLIEDCAQAHGATYKGKRVGAFGEMSCFSFYPGKNLGAYGEGGAVLTDRAELAAALRSLRNHGSEVRYQHDRLGFNFRMDGAQGAILSVKLKHLGEWTERRQEIARRYREGVRNPKVRLQLEPEGLASVYHLFVALVDDRARFTQHLAAHEIQVGQHYPVPIHLQKAYQHLGHKPGDFPNAERLAARCVSLPMFPELADADVARVIEAVNRY